MPFERIEVGTYRIDTSTFTLEGDGTVTVSFAGADAMQQFVDIATADNYEIPRGTNPVGRIRSIILEFDPDAIVMVTWTPRRVGPMSWEQGTSWMTIIQDIADAAQLRVLVDRRGRYRIRPRDSFNTEVSANFAGYVSGDGQLLSASRTIRRNGIVNGVIVRGESLSTTSDPVEARVWVSEGATQFADSPEFDSAIGPMPLVHVDRGIETEEHARRLALDMLHDSAGIPEVVTIEVLADPRIRTGDVIPVRVPEIGAFGNYTVASTRMTSSSTGEQTMTVVMSERRDLGAPDVQVIF